MAAVEVTCALDWHINTNHAGFVAAQHQQYYAEEGIQCALREPSEPYTPPAELVRSGAALFCVAPSETVISSNTQSKRPPLQAVATILQSDSSAIATLASSGLDRPRKLDGKRYASYAARYEGRIVQELIRSDGGRGDFQELTPPVLGIFDTLMKGTADATWIFKAWEGVEAQHKGVELNTFSLGDYGIPYGYTPLLITLPSTLQEQPDLVRRFLRATARGFQYAAAHPERTADMLLAAAPDLDARLVHASQALVSKNYLDKDGRWGTMEAPRWEAFLDWLSEKGLLTSAMPSRSPVEGESASLDELRQGKAGERIPREAVKSESLFTNGFLPQGQ